MDPAIVPKGKGTERIFEEDFEAVLRSVQSGPLEDPPWSGLVARLRARLGCNFANLIFRRAGADPATGIEVHDASAPPAWLWDRYRERFARSEEHTSELQSLMRISYAVFCLKKKNHTHNSITITYSKQRQFTS